MPVPMPGFVRVDALSGIVVGLGYVAVTQRNDEHGRAAGQWW
jgi:hypothetical protein